MADLRTESLTRILNMLFDRAGGNINGCAIVTMDGITLVAKLPSDADPDRMGAIAGTMQGVAERAMRDLASGRTEELIVKGEQGMLMVLGAGAEAVLAVTMPGNGNLGMARLEAREAARQVTHILSPVLADTARVMAPANSR